MARLVGSNHTDAAGRLALGTHAWASGPGHHGLARLLAGDRHLVGAVAYTSVARTVCDHRGRIGVVDALWRDHDVISEKEGMRFHTTPGQRRRDVRRFNRLLDARYAVRRFTWLDVVERPVEVAATLTRALAAAGADVDLARLPNRIVMPVDPRFPATG